MKKSCLAVATLAMVAGTAYAQSNVTLSGVVGVGVRYSTNANPSGDTKWSMGANPDSYGIFRLAGNEDIGDGYKAHFQLEGAFMPDTGEQPASGSANGLFGRQATVGLTTPFGRFDLGRMNVAGTAAEPIVMADPTNAGGQYPETLWPGAYTGIRTDNSIRYRLVVNGVTAGALYSFGEQAGNDSKASIMSGTLGYATGPFSSLATYQVAKDLAEKTVKTVSLGAIYRLSPELSLHGSYVNAKAEKGFSGAVAYSRTGLGNFASDQTLNFFLAGATYQATPAITLRAAYYYGKTSGGTFIDSGKILADKTFVGPINDGKIQTVYLVGNYALSKRTSLVAGIDYNKWSDGFSGYWGSTVESKIPALGTLATNGKDTRTNVSVGVRHVF